MIAHLLGSFHYLGHGDLSAMVERERAAGLDVDFFADSGAFSAMTVGAQISLPDYAAWLREHAPVINCAATLDVIGDPVASARNTDRLLDLVGDQVVIVPAFHIGSPWAELERLVTEHRYVALGGVVKARPGPPLAAWLVKAHRIAEAAGALLHGFGATRPPYSHLVPWYSVDSAYWESASRTGTLSLFDQRRGGVVQVRVGRKMTPDKARLVRAYGMDPAAAARRGFGIIAANPMGEEAGRAQREWLDTASIASRLAYAAHIARTRAPIPPPDGVRGDGFKAYFAVSGTHSWKLLTRTLRALESSP